MPLTLRFRAAIRYFLLEAHIAREGNRCLKISWDCSERRTEEKDSISNLEVQAKKLRASRVSNCLRKDVQAANGFVNVFARRALRCFACFLFGAALISADAQHRTDDAQAKPIYRQAGAPIEKRIDDLLKRMTLEEKARQLDLYAGARYSGEDKHSGKHHAAPDAIFLSR